MKKELRYTIINGLQSTVLQYSPIGWDKSIINIERSLKTWGITRTYSIELRFPKDGAEILRNCFYNMLVNPVYLQIEKYDKILMRYKIFYTGLIDFQDYEDLETEVKISVVVMNLTAIIKKYFSETFYYGNHRSPTIREYYLSEDDKLKISLYDDLERPLQVVKISKLIEFVFYSMKDVTPEKFGCDLTAVTDIEDNDSYPVITTERAISGIDNTGLGADEYVYRGYSHRLSHLNTSFESITTNLFNIYGLSWSVVVVDGIETLKFNSLADTFPATVFKKIENLNNVTIRTSKDLTKGELFAGFDFQPDSDIFTYNNGSATVQYNVNNEIVSSIKYDLNNKTSSNEMFDIRSSWQVDWFSIINKYFIDYEIIGSEDILQLIYVHDVDGVICPVRDTKINSSTGISTISVGAKELSTRHIIDNLKGLIKSLTITPYVYVNYLEHYPTSIENFITDFPDGIPKKEFSNFSIADNERYFLPIEIEFEGVIPDIDIIDMYEPANSLYEFDFEGNTYSGYLIKAEINTSGKEKGKFTLLLHSENDFTKLIR